METGGSDALRIDGTTKSASSDSCFEWSIENPPGRSKNAMGHYDPLLENVEARCAGVLARLLPVAGRQRPPAGYGPGTAGALISIVSALARVSSSLPAGDPVIEKMYASTSRY